MENWHPHIFACFDHASANATSTPKRPYHRRPGQLALNGRDPDRGY